MIKPAEATLSDAQRQALEWLSRQSDTEYGDEQQQAFQDWLRIAPEHGEAYRQAQQFWEQLGGLPDIADKPLKAARGFVRQTQAGRRRRNTLLILAAIAVGLFMHKPDPWLKLTAVRYQTAKGQRQAVELADGSRVELNTASSVCVDRFSSRMVWLEQGEAWFDVKHDADKPFEVRVGNGRIQDVGTQFNVAIDREQATVTVAEGEVALTVPEKPTLALTAGLQSRFHTDGSQLQMPTASDANPGVWRDGMLIFKRQPLPEVLRQLTRYHQIEFEILDTKLQTVTVSGRFSTTDLNESLSTLSNGLGVRMVKLAPDKIAIRAHESR